MSAWLLKLPLFAFLSWLLIRTNYIFQPEHSFALHSPSTHRSPSFIPPLNIPAETGVMGQRSPSVSEYSVSIYSIVCILVCQASTISILVCGHNGRILHCAIRLLTVLVSFFPLRRRNFVLGCENFFSLINETTFLVQNDSPPRTKSFGSSLEKRMGESDEGVVRDMNNSPGLVSFIIFNVYI